MNSRAIAAKALAQVLGHRQSLDSALSCNLRAAPDPAARALAQELCYGVLRWHQRLEVLARALLHTPVKDKDIYCLLLLGLYQLMYLRIAPHAAVNQTVGASEALGKPWAKGFLNAVLRAYLRNSVGLLEKLERSELAVHSHPRWLMDAIKAAWPERWQTILAASNERPPMSLRVNARRLTRAVYLERLAASGIEAFPVPFAPCGILLKKAVAVEDLPGFAEGLVSVQDAAAQWAAPLLELEPGQRVLDACAAPGGKTCHILESEPSLEELVALDCNEARLARVRENLDRLDLSATSLLGDAAAPEAWWDGRPFDRILLDAPCSGTGVIRRHPDIKWLRRSGDIPSYALQQERLVTNLWPLLQSGGMLLYATCSILPQENEHQVERFLAVHPEARAQAIAFPWRRETKTAGQQILPGEQGMDGFYYARLRKR